MGTLRYMAPERFHEDDVQPPSDVFALGSVLYEGLAGERFFGGMSLQATALAVFAFYSPAAGENRTITNLSRLLGTVAVLAMVWLFAAYGGMGESLPHPAIGQKIFTLATDLWFLLVALFLLRTRA